jgi:hypothetical protein
LPDWALLAVKGIGFSIETFLLPKRSRTREYGHEITGDI